MVTAEFLVALRRRWYVVIVGLVASGLAVYWVGSRPPVYWSQVDVVLVGPPSARYPNSIANSPGSLIVMAGLMEREFNKGRDDLPATASSAVTLPSQGIRDGWQVRLPNAGGQWGANFHRPVLDVQVVGPDPLRVRQRLDEVVARVQRLLDDMQAEDDVPPDRRITTFSAPNRASVFTMGGHPARAQAVTLLLGLALTGISAAGVDRRARRRRRAASPRETISHERSRARLKAAARF